MNIFHEQGSDIKRDNLYTLVYCEHLLSAEFVIAVKKVGLLEKILDSSTPRFFQILILI
jgi:hypothetical protein